MLFDRQPEEAVRLWSKTIELDPTMAIAYRNLAVAYSRQDNGAPKAIAALEKAVSLGSGDALHLYELDRLCEFAQTPVEKRLALFDSHRAAAEKRDDATARIVSLEILAGRYDSAIKIMTERHFHLWEGGALQRAGRLDRRRTCARPSQVRRQGLRRRACRLSGLDGVSREPRSDPRLSRQPRAGGLLLRGPHAIRAGQPGRRKKAWRESAAELIGTEDVPRATVDNGAVLVYYQALSPGKVEASPRAKALFASLASAAAKAETRPAGQEFFAVRRAPVAPRAWPWLTTWAACRARRRRQRRALRRNSRRPSRSTPTC
ncbi:MAG: hypothetical protein IPP47_00500 [Bryobacterales bacterium]|nr:hypothetical protein [Bryobacterales bacterium]